MKKWTVILFFGNAATFGFLRDSHAPDYGDKGARTPAQGPFTYLANALDYIASMKKTGSCTQKPAFFMAFTKKILRSPTLPGVEQNFSLTGVPRP